MAKERKSHRLRREAHFLIASGAALPRRPPTKEEVDKMMWAISRRNNNIFGVRTLIALELDDLHAFRLISWRNFESQVTMIAYAAWRLRHCIVKSFLVAGASPTVSSRLPEGGVLEGGDDTPLCMLLKSLAGAAAVCVIEQVVHLRARAAREKEALPPCALCGADGLSLPITCGCVCCERCVWRGLMAGAGGPRHGELCCPMCDVCVVAPSDLGA